VQRIDLKVNVSCCEGCRRKVMKAMSLKGHARYFSVPSLSSLAFGLCSVRSDSKRARHGADVCVSVRGRCVQAC
jgi:hypothetical protein